MPEFHRPLKVFLSYASQDKTSVRELSARLVGEGWIDTWQDEKDLLPGQDWRVKIEEAVEGADVVIIVLSQHSVSKEGYVQKELRYAREIALEKPEDTIFLIPLRLDECEVPRGLRFYQWVDYFDDKKSASYKALVTSLKFRYEQKLKLEEAERLRKEKADREAAEIALREKEAKELASVLYNKFNRALQLEDLGHLSEALKIYYEIKTANPKYVNIENKIQNVEKSILIAKEEARRLALEQVKQKKAQRRIAQTAALKNFFSKLFISAKSVVPSSFSLIRNIGFFVFGIILVVVGARVVSILPTVGGSFASTQTSVPTLTFTPILPTATITPTFTPTFTPTVTLEPTSTAIPDGFVKMPSVIDLKYEDAKSILNKLGLIVESKDVVKNDESSKIITDQIPSQGEIIQIGETVVLYQTTYAEPIPLSAMQSITLENGKIYYYTFDFNTTDSYIVKVKMNSPKYSSTILSVNVLDLELNRLTSTRNQNGEVVAVVYDDVKFPVVAISQCCLDKLDIELTISKQIK